MSHDVVKQHDISHDASFHKMIHTEMNNITYKGIGQRNAIKQSYLLATGGSFQSFLNASILYIYSK